MSSYPHDVSSAARPVGLRRIQTMPGAAIAAAAIFRPEV